MKISLQHRLCATILSCLCFIFDARISQASEHLGVGTPTTAWFITHRTDADSALLLMLRDDPLGSIRPGVAATPLPQAIAARGTELIAVYAPFRSPRSATDAEAESSMIRAVRRYQAEPITPTQTLIRGPLAMPPIPGPGNLIGLVHTSVPAVLLEHETALRLLIFERGAWMEIAAPHDLPADAMLTLLPITGRPAILARSRATNDSWVYQYSIDEGPEGGIRWKRRSLAVPLDTERIVVIDDQILALARADSPHVLRIDALRSDSVLTRAHLSGVPGDYRAFGFGDVLVLAWDAPDAEPSPPIIAAIALDGRILREPAPAIVVGPVTAEDVQLLLLALASIFLTAIVFIARPGARYDNTFPLPPDTALAPPFRRTLAATIDLLPGLGLGAALGSDALPLWGLSEWVDGLVGVLLVGAVVTIVHTSATEAMSGRTLGKWTTRCRTISHTGKKPTALQAIGRNATKILCPPLAILTLLAPYGPNPGSFATRVTVRTSANNASPDSSDRSNSP